MIAQTLAYWLAGLLVLATPSLPIASHGAVQPQVPIAERTSLGPVLTAQSAVLVDRASGAVLWAKNADAVRPLASLTKLATALVYMSEHQDLDRAVALKAEDWRAGGALKSRSGDAVTARDLLGASLIGSSNSATVALSRANGDDEQRFIAAMNRYASARGWANTFFTEPTGLAPTNVSTAREVAQLLNTALAQPVLSDYLTTPEYTVVAVNRDFSQRFASTDELFGTFLTQPPYALLGAKTGFINESGYNFAVAVRVPDGRELIAVILGAPTNEERFANAQRLLGWAAENR